MLWDIRARMKPALSIIDLIPNVHRTPALAALRRAVVEGRPAAFRLDPDDRELAFHEANVQLTSPIGARVLKGLYLAGDLKLKKPGLRPVPTLDAYIATEPAFRAEVARILAAEAARLQRLAAIIADPDTAQPEELTVALIDKVFTARLGHAAQGTLLIGGLACHRSLAPAATDDRLRAEDRMVIWWHDLNGQRLGDPAA
ncbi:MAG: hypothetical protein EAZ40_04030 [Rhodobacterales bacterium]|nr:MAG: hypothetical protein EAZ40_04030 [Rhodobacterales bacterium]